MKLDLPLVTGTEDRCESIFVLEGAVEELETPVADAEGGIIIFLIVRCNKGALLPGSDCFITIWLLSVLSDGMVPANIHIILKRENVTKKIIVKMIK